jgi:TolB-like protein
MTDPGKAVFLSYASQDAEAARRLCDALRAAGVEVWFDQSELRGGDAWDQKIRQQIYNCRLFIPVISANTEQRDEGYFRREWAIAVDRTRDIVHKRAFLVPVVIDGTAERGASVPEKFHELQWVWLPNGSTTPVFVERVFRLLLPSDPPVPATENAAPVMTDPIWIWIKRYKVVEWTVMTALLIIAGSVLWVLQRSHGEPLAGAVAGLPREIANIVPPPFAPPAHSIAVLPFTNLSGDPKQEYFSDGVSEELINALSQVNTLQVTARTSSFFFKGKDVDLETIAHKLNVGAILEGSVRRDGSTVRITAELINAATGFHMWSQKYDRELRSVLALQSEIAETVAEQLQVPLLGAAAIHLEAGGTQNPEAYDAYLRGKGIYYSTEDETGNRAALAEFDRAIALDPHFAAAYGRRAIALIGISGEVKSVAERDALREEANTAAQRAVTLAPDRADVHTALWAVRARGYFDFRSAEISRALALAPGSTLAHQCAALQASWSGHHDLALQEAREAVNLDPQSLEARMYVVNALTNARRFNEALVALQQAKAIRPDEQSIRSYTAYIYRLQGRDNLVEQQRLCEQPHSTFCLALVKHARGDLSGANEELVARKAEWGDSGAYDYARIYAQWGDAPLAMRSLRTAERLHDPGMVELKVDPLLDPIRNQPEFKALEQRLNFPP